MECLYLIFMIVVIQETSELNPDILKYDEWIKDAEIRVKKIKADEKRHVEYEKNKDTYIHDKRESNYVPFYTSVTPRVIQKSASSPRSFYLPMSTQDRKSNSTCVIKPTIEQMAALREYYQLAITVVVESESIKEKGQFTKEWEEFLHQVYDLKERTENLFERIDRLALESTDNVQGVVNVDQEEVIKVLKDYQELIENKLKKGMDDGANETSTPTGIPSMSSPGMPYTIDLVN